MPDAGSIQGTTKLDVQFADIEGTAALEVQSLGVGFADLRIDISDTSAQPKAKAETLLPCVQVAMPSRRLLPYRGCGIRASVLTTTSLKNSVLLAQAWAQQHRCLRLQMVKTVWWKRCWQQHL